MLTPIIFILSLAVIVFSLIMKKIETERGQKIFLAKLFERSDIFILESLGILKREWLKLNFTNAKLLFSRIVASIKAALRSVKRRLDHKHSPFFTKQDESSSHKGAVSFFLKDVSEYKKKLREGEIDNLN